MKSKLTKTYSVSKAFIQSLPKYKDNFTESEFWKKLTVVSKKIGRTPTYYALILFYVLNSPTVSLKNKGIILGALGYLILPFDLVSDFIPVLGLMDDIAILKMVYDAVKLSVTPDITAKADQKVKEWFD